MRFTQRNTEWLTVFRHFLDHFPWAPKHGIIRFQGFLHTDRYQLLVTYKHQAPGPKDFSLRLLGMRILQSRPWSYRTLPSSPPIQSIFLPSLLPVPLPFGGWFCSMTTTPSLTPSLSSPGLGPMNNSFLASQPDLDTVLHAPYNLTLLLPIFLDTYSL